MRRLSLAPNWQGLEFFKTEALLKHYQAYQKELATFVHTDLGNLKPQDQPQLMAGVVMGVRIRMTQRGKMAIVTLDDAKSLFTKTVHEYFVYANLFQSLPTNNYYKENQTYANEFVAINCGESETTYLYSVYNATNKEVISQVFSYSDGLVKVTNKKVTDMTLENIEDSNKVGQDCDSCLAVIQRIIGDDKNENKDDIKKKELIIDILKQRDGNKDRIIDKVNSSRHSHWNRRSCKFSQILVVNHIE
jgi:hypothetical protein